MSRELARLITGQIFLHACMAGMRMATPLLALKQGYSAVAVGALMSLFALTQVFIAVPAGRYTDRVGLRKPVAAAVGVAALGALLSALWPVFPMLCVSALATGGATGVTVIALQRHVGRLASDPAELKSAFSWLSIGPAISNFVGPVVAGLLIDFRRQATIFNVGDSRVYRVRNRAIAQLSQDQSGRLGRPVPDAEVVAGPFVGRRCLRQRD